MKDLTRTLTEIAERGTPIGSARLRERVMLDLAADASASRRRRFSVSRPVWAFAGAAAAMLVLLGVVPLLLRTFSDGESVAATTMATIAPSTTPPPTTTLPATTLPLVPPPVTESTATPTTIPSKPASLQISWQRVPEQPALEHGWISAVTPGGPGYVAVGGTVGCSDPASPSCDDDDAAVWVSADGLTWERIGSQSFRGDAAREARDGDRIDGHQYMNDVTLGPAGLVAVGAAPVIDPDRPAGYLDRPGIWLSPDGRQWERLAYDEDLFSGVEELLRIVTFGDRLVAVGEADAWLSDDGTDWERVAIDSNIFAGVLDLTIWNEALVAVGGVDGNPAVWMSEDGLSWSQVDDADFGAAFVILQGVGGNADGLVALGAAHSNGIVSAWSSVDGNDWAVAPEWNEQVWGAQARTALSVSRGTGGIEDDIILINGPATLWGTANGGDQWFSAGEFDGGLLEALIGSASSAFNTINQVLIVDNQLLAFGKVVAWSGTEPIGACYLDTGWCRADAAIWVGTWDGAP
jgi:hypothetical protein